jgi:hypothetical protein
MRSFLIALMFAGLVLCVPNAYSSPTGFSLSDEFLMAMDDTYTLPFPGWADVVSKTDVPGLGVEYDVALYGITEITVGIGARYDLDLSSYSDYFLTFTNTSVDDTFNVSLYLKTGAEETVYSSGWWTLLPSPFPNTAELSWDLSSVANLDDVREIGFSLSGWMGNEFGMADSIRVKVEDDPNGPVLDPPNGDPVPEAGTLMLFGSGLVGLLAFARRKLSFLSK